MNYFLDTNICIFYLKGQFPKIKDIILQKIPSQIKVPAIVKAELLFGARKSKKVDENLNNILSFLEPFEIVPFEDAATPYYAKIRAELELTGKMIGPNDLIIASSILLYEATLVTNNTGEFSRVTDLSIEDWTK